MANKEMNSIKSGKLRSKVNYDVVFSYNGRNSVLAPGQEVSISDFSKVGKINPIEIIKIENK